MIRPILPCRALTLCLCIYSSIGSLFGANRIFFGDQEILAGLGPQGILVRCNNDFDVYGVSLSVKFDPAALQVRTVETVGVASDAEWVPGAELQQIDNLSGELTFAFLMEFDFSDPQDNVIPPGLTQPIVKFTVDVLAAAPAQTVVDLVDGLGSGQILGRNALSDGGGNTYRADSSVFPLSLGGGTIRIESPNPVVENLAGNRGRSGTEFTVTGRNFFAPVEVRVCGLSATFVRTDDQTLTVEAPDCGTLAWTAVEVCTAHGCDTVAEGFFYEAPDSPLPAINSLISNLGLAGQKFVVEGENLGEPGLSVEVCGQTADATFFDGGLVQVTAPECGATGWVPISVCTDHGCDSAAEGFFYEEIPLPIITDVANNRGRSGVDMIVSGVNLSQLGTVVEVCSVQADFTVISDDTIVVTAPDCPTTGWAPLKICNAHGCTSLAQGFFYEQETLFIRADVNDDGRIDISDPIGVLQDQFMGVPARAPCRDALDSNDDGKVDISDSVFLLSYLFVGGLVIPPPHPKAGTDPTPDLLPEC